MNRKATFTLLIMALLYFATPFSAHAAEKLVFSGIESINSDISFKVLEEAYGRIGIEIELKHYPILRALHSSDSGIVDGELFKKKGLDNKYPNLTMIHVPVNNIESMVLTNKSSPPFTDWQSLAPFRIGIYRGVAFTKEKTAKAGCTQVFELDTHDQMIKMLEINRIDAAIVARIAGLIILRKAGPTEIKLTEPPLESFPVYHYLNKKHSNLVPKLTAVLKQMQKERRIQQIREEIIQKEFGTLGRM
ncbi:ABC transporter substrate-binding protein [Maridesulfovibrio ferrireducens]|uniref:substrate-binding periplasmic protein n=1 Tax=Maridesulfovibrio ferrireducens TaxID=246191 RepID=UPI001A2C632F|nr:transporter substrate-binding domain-containing protein [Maridesulfovibrio ferrireducens]MBI9111937.1 transporter substrate-binding domain-containing protein [Maridesulfovibrio ferrireducens]